MVCGGIFVFPSVWVEILFWEGLELEKRRIPKIVSFSEAIDGLETDLEPMDINTVAISLPSEISSSDVTTLEGHTSKVFGCAWSLEGSFLASGSEDSTTRIWSIGDGPCNYTIKTRKIEKNKNVTTLDWNNEINAIEWDPSGSLLASCYEDTTFKEISTIKWSPTGVVTSNTIRINSLLARFSITNILHISAADYGSIIVHS
uniref:WD-40 repeat family protein n=1 Tax=Solanum tuberosum TaxID=4113 RepID=M1DYV6_SOLTU